MVKRCKKVSGYIVYMTKCMIDAYNKNIGASASDRMVLCSGEWKNLEDKDRDKFKLEAAKRRELCKTQQIVGAVEQ